MDDNERKALLIHLRFEAARIRQALRDSENFDPDPKRTDVLLDQLNVLMKLIKELESM